MVLCRCAMLLGVNADRRTALRPRMRDRMFRAARLDQGLPDRQRPLVAPSCGSHRQAVRRYSFCAAPSNSQAPSSLLSARRVSDLDPNPAAQVTATRHEAATEKVAANWRRRGVAANQVLLIYPTAASRQTNSSSSDRQVQPLLAHGLACRGDEGVTIGLKLRAVFRR